jgi:hypothetical protein
MGAESFASVFPRSQLRVNFLVHPVRVLPQCVDLLRCQSVRRGPWLCCRLRLFRHGYHRGAPRQAPERDTASGETLTGSAITGIAVISSGTGISSAAVDCIGTVTACTDRSVHATPESPAHALAARLVPASPSSRCRLASDDCQRKRDVCYTLMNRHRQHGWLRPLSARTIRTQ